LALSVRRISFTGRRQADRAVSDRGFSAIAIVVAGRAPARPSADARNAAKRDVDTAQSWTSSVNVSMNSNVNVSDKNVACALEVELAH
jgi:hypothetical protein